MTNAVKKETPTVADIELGDFVKNALVQLALGVSAANKELHEKHDGPNSDAPFHLFVTRGEIGKGNSGVQFDVAVTASSGTADHAGAKISVAHVFGIGANTEATSDDTYAHRIRFEVGLNQSWG